jgi:hypothetical protein
MADNNDIVLQEIINELCNPNTTLAGPLLKLYYLAVKVKNDELAFYASNEINGYELKDLPEYRIAAAAIIVDIQVGYDQIEKEVPASLLEDGLGNVLKHIKIKEGVSVLEEMVSRGNNASSGQLLFPLPMEILPSIQPSVNKLYKSNKYLNVQGAKQVTNYKILIKILSVVRTKLLRLAMTLAGELGANLTISTLSKKEQTNPIIYNFMHNEITNTGDSNIVNTGDHSTITAKIEIRKGEIEEFKKSLKDHGVDDDDIREITEIVNIEKPDLKNNELGPQTKGWISKVAGKSVSGVGKVAIGTVANLLATVIKAHIGMV